MEDEGVMEGVAKEVEVESVVEAQLLPGKHSNKLVEFAAL
jgi:hypothetical protein